MASATTLQASYIFFLKPQTKRKTHLLAADLKAARTRRTNRSGMGVFATQGRSKRPRAPAGVDTRIHWDNKCEGWIGGSSNSQQTKDKEKLNAEEEQRNHLLGVSAESDVEEIEAAYRRLSKEYHPDTTSLPLKAASEKFMKLREVYNVLSTEESRRFYDWTLAQEAATIKAEKLRMKLEDPYKQDLRNYKPKPDMVDRLGGKNTELSDQH